MIRKAASNFILCQS